MYPVNRNSSLRKLSTDVTAIKDTSENGACFIISPPAKRVTVHEWVPKDERIGAWRIIRTVPSAIKAKLEVLGYSGDLNSDQDKKNAIVFLLQFKAGKKEETTTQIQILQALIDTLTSLDFGETDIDPARVKELFDALKINTTLTSLSLNGKKIDDKVAHALCEALQKNTTLTSLDFGNEINPARFKDLFDALKINTTLTSLSLNGRKIDDEVAHALCEVLQRNTTLTSLSLPRNSIGNEGAAALSEVLQKNTTLTTLHLIFGEMRIDGWGYERLSEMLKKNTTLTSLGFLRTKVFNEEIRMQMQIERDKLIKQKKPIKLIMQQLHFNELSIPYRKYKAVSGELALSDTFWRQLVSSRIFSSGTPVVIFDVLPSIMSAVILLLKETSYTLNTVEEKEKQVRAVLEEIGLCLIIISNTSSRFKINRAVDD